MFACAELVNLKQPTVQSLNNTIRCKTENSGEPYVWKVLRAKEKLVSNKHVTNCMLGGVLLVLF